LHTGPLLLYFGQEAGVRAEGSEGFSGDDGRTTIFDYWGIPEWQGYLNGNARLTTDQQQLRAFYQRLNHLVSQSDAIRNGAFYDLQWANQNTPGYNGDRLYAYLRYTSHQKLLVICNFDQYQPAETSVQIPAHAWQLMGLPETQTYTFIDIFNTSFHDEAVGLAGLPVTLPPLSVLMLEIH